MTATVPEGHEPPEGYSYKKALTNTAVWGAQHQRGEVFLCPDQVVDRYESAGYITDPTQEELNEHLGVEPTDDESGEEEAASEAETEPEGEADQDEAPDDESGGEEDEGQEEDEGDEPAPEPESDADAGDGQEEDEGESDKTDQAPEEESGDEDELEEWDLDMSPQEYLNRGYEKHADLARRVIEARGGEGGTDEETDEETEEE